MKKFNVAKSVENEKKKSQPEKKIFYSLLLCVFAAALFTSFFSGKTAKKMQDAAKSGAVGAKQASVTESAPYIPPEESANAETDVKKEEISKTSEEIPKKGDQNGSKTEVEAPSSSPEVEMPKSPEVTGIIKPVNGEILKLFSDKMPVYSKTMDDWRVHDGIDISAKIGDSVFACASGVVEDIFDDKNMGTTVIIDHNGIKSKYQNLSPNVAVKKGDSVGEGAVIGVVGDSAAYEIADAPHLHFELSDGKVQINPEKLFR